MILKKIFYILALGCSFLSYGQDFFTYRVKDGDNRWKIAKDFGISLDSLNALNPQLSYDQNSLPVDVLITLPKPFGFNPSREHREVLQAPPLLNPHVFHQVKPKETYYDIVRNYGISYLDLLRMNPGIKLSGIQVGMNLKVKTLDSLTTFYDPYFKEDVSIKKRKLNKTLRFVYALPFRIDKMNFLDTLIADKTIEARTDMKLSLNFYQGALVAIDSLRKMGVLVESFPVDTQLNPSSLNLRLSQIDSIVPDAIFGPLSERNYSAAVFYARKKDIPIVFPAASSSNISYEKAYYPVPEKKVFRDRLLNLSKLRYTNEKVLVIADQENQDAATAISSSFQDALNVDLINDVSVDIDTLTTQLDSLIPNWVFVETRNLKLASSVSSILASSIRDSVRIKMFTTNRNRAFENDIIDNQQLTGLNFTFPSFYKHFNNVKFAEQYEEKFGLYPDRFALRGFDLTMDFALRLLMSEMEDSTQKKYITHLIEYRRDSLKLGFYNRASAILRYENMDVKEYH